MNSQAPKNEPSSAAKSADLENANNKVGPTPMEITRADEETNENI